MTRSHLPRVAPTPDVPGECAPTEDFGSNAVAAERSEALATDRSAATWQRADDGVAASGTVEGGASVFADGLGADGKVAGKASGETVDGLTFDGELALGGGLVARARAVEGPDPDTVLVVVTVGASAGLSGSTKGAHGARLGLEGGVAGEATSTIGRAVPPGEAGALAEAWAAGSLGPWLDTFGALAAIGRFASDAADAQIADLAPGEFLRRTSSVDARICLPAAWRGVSVAAGASHNGQRVATAEARTDGALTVEIAFDSAVTRQIDGTVTVGEIAVGAGLSDAERVGLTVRFAFDRHAEAEAAEWALGAASARELEEVAAAVPWAVLTHTVRGGEGATARPRVGVPGVAVAGEHTRRLDEAVALGDGLDGTTFSASSSDGLGVALGGHEVASTRRTASIAASVDGGVTATIAQGTEGKALRPRFGVTPQDTWPATLRSALFDDTKHLFAIDLSEADIEEVVRVRPLRVDAWDAAGLAAGSEAGRAWRDLGSALRTLEPPASWVEAGGERIAVLAAGVRLLAGFVAAHDSRAWRALYGVTRRFGAQTGEADEHGSLGAIVSWPPGTEDWKALYEAARARQARLVDDLDAAAAAGDLAKGRELHHAVARPLDELTAAIPRLDVDPAEGRLWQSDLLDRLATLRSEVEWEYAMFQRGFAECDTATGHDLAPGVAEGKQREAFALLGTMRSYAALEQRVFSDHRGPYAKAEHLQAVVQPLHKAWRGVYERWQRAEPGADPARAATPDWEAYRESLLQMNGVSGRSAVAAMAAPSRRLWGL